MSGARDWRSMMEDSARLLRKRTGAGVEEWNARVRASGADDTEGQLRSWLTGQGVTGYAQALLVMERFGYPDFLTATADELIDAQYADRPALRPVLDAILGAATGFDEVHVQARKTYVSLVGPRRTFALVRASTARRVDLGLRLEPQGTEGRLLPARSLGNDDFRWRIALASPDDVDDEVVAWLRRAYEVNL
ncbi:hypothetical protein CDO52_23325 [Nocardiopsis gilva YIM 90087]|uniref:DUF5655 domain-containing protein n=1 Tax=Nocardiopsis gilva YIM 90087 TaxID=1235441 RepID=A0A223SB71_9ACTN|nr:DUF5655 domain-containing protein [Nocardiopsis gilva]ASU85335.1 hypothetical protein CDO52_23325 [Nocardiopsis gilva YIM 90087]